MFKNRKKKMQKRVFISWTRRQDSARTCRRIVWVVIVVEAVGMVFLWGSFGSCFVGASCCIHSRCRRCCRLVQLPSPVCRLDSKRFVVREYWPVYHWRTHHAYRHCRTTSRRLSRAFRLSRTFPVSMGICSSCWRW